MAKKIIEKSSQEPVWEPARLIPVSGIRNAEEQERRATSALLAIIGSVEEFGQAIVLQCGARKGKIETYIEVPFKLENEKNVRPDGVIRCHGRKGTTTILVEVKTGKNTLNKEQVETYLDVAKEQGFDCVLTISNEIQKIPGEHPVAVDKKKLKKVNLFHMSWSNILTEAFIQRDDKGIADPDQAYMLGELIRYLEHPNAGSVDFNDMGEHWIAVRDGVKDGTLRKNDNHAFEVAGKWEELVTFAALEMSRQLGSGVQEVLTSAERKDLGIRISNIVNDIVNDGIMKGTIRIPNTIGDIELVADLRSQQIKTSVKVNAPESGRSTTRINWLLRQLKKTTVDVTVESWGLRSRHSMSELLSKALEKPEKLIPEENRDIKSFTITMNEQMGLSRSAGKKSFVDSVLGAIKEFYVQVVQHLSEWQPPTPKIGGTKKTVKQESPTKSLTDLASKVDEDKLVVEPKSESVTTAVAPPKEIDTIEPPVEERNSPKPDPQISKPNPSPTQPSTSSTESGDSKS